MNITITDQFGTTATLQFPHWESAASIDVGTDKVVITENTNSAGGTLMDEAGDIITTEDGDPILID